MLSLSVLLGGYVYSIFRFHKEEQRVDLFFTALMAQNYEQAYQIWKPSQYYQYKDFLADWGPSGMYGVITRYRILSSRSRGSAIVVRVRFNRRRTFSIWVDKKDMSFSFPPPI
ncbi:MAG: hypothetical protein A3F68_03385 [Acidobacteria bacterium RIFCSPLOWO2_12_FULL_54_10]|nr:MAG: hypothetical protein A3F68_03385 [Acidobacteria bacterium RIFCSPLOWO2_12_FULL_54_10]